MFHADNEKQKISNDRRNRTTKSKKSERSEKRELTSTWEYSEWTPFDKQI